MRHDRRPRAHFASDMSLVEHEEPANPEPPRWAKVVALVLLSPALIVAGLVVGKVLRVAASWALS